MYKTRPQIKEIVEEYKQALNVLGINVERVLLYGSHALGNQREDSDIDLAVVSADFQTMNLRERLEVLGIAAARIMQPIEARCAERNGHGFTAQFSKRNSRGRSEYIE